MQHCDALSGPVVEAAKKSIETGNINHVLIWIPKKAEKELQESFKQALAARKSGKEALHVADQWFYETAVRLHRAGEGEGFTGLKPAGPTDPIVAAAEKALANKNADKFIDSMGTTVKEVLEERFKHAVHAANYDTDDVQAGRKYIEAYMEFVVFAHHLHDGLSKNHQIDERSKKLH